MFRLITSFLINDDKNYIKTTKGSLFLIFATIFNAFMYFPFYLYIPAIDPFWSKLYLYISPFGIIPFLVGIISLIISAKYNRVVLSTLFAYMYIQAILISLIRVMSLDTYKELLIFIPHFLIILEHIFIWIYKLEKNDRFF